MLSTSTETNQLHELLADLPAGTMKSGKDRNHEPI